MIDLLSLLPLSQTFSRHSCRKTASSQFQQILRKLANGESICVLPQSLAPFLIKLQCPLEFSDMWHGHTCRLPCGMAWVNIYLSLYFSGVFSAEWGGCRLGVTFFVRCFFWCNPGQFSGSDLQLVVSILLFHIHVISGTGTIMTWYFKVIKNRFSLSSITAV